MTIGDFQAERAALNNLISQNANVAGQATNQIRDLRREITLTEALLSGDYRRFTDLTDFLGTFATNGAQLGGEGVEVIVAGTGAQVTQGTFFLLANGLAGLSTGSTSTGQCGIRFANVPLFYLHDKPFVFSALVLKPSADSDGTNTHTIYTGLLASATGVPLDGGPGSGIYFTADKNAHTNFQAVTNNAGTTTVTDTGVSCAVAGDLSHLLTVEILTGTNSAKFYIDGDLVATHATNLPADLTAIVAGVEIIKSAGTTARFAYVDLMSLHVADLRATQLTGLA